MLKPRSSVIQVMSLSLLLVVGMTSCAKEKESNDTNRPPNIIFILADDMGYADAGCYGQEHFETPNIDRLAAKGMLFTNHYAGTAVCSPSRSSLITGQHTGHTDIRDNKSYDPAPYGQREIEGQWPIGDSTLTLPKLLKGQGYVTGAFGKWGLGAPRTYGEPTQQGFDRFYGYVCQSLAHNYYPEHLWDNQEKVILEGNLDGQFGAYAPDLIHDKALQFIKEQKDNPFFLFLPTNLPHAELLAPEANMEKYRGQFPEGEPYQGVDSGVGFREGALASQDKPRTAYAAMMDVLDTQVGEIMETVKSLGLEENTIIIFTSDNGPHVEGGNDPEFFDSNGPFRGIKRDLYEGGIRMPLLVSWPGKIAANSTSDHVSAFWDFLPTFAELTDSKEGKSRDGISFLPTLLGDPENQQQHDHLYWEYHGENGKQAVRKGKWKGVRNDIRKGNKKVELYDLSQDPGEQHDIASKHPDIVQELTAILENDRTPSEIFGFGYLDELKTTK